MFRSIAKFAGKLFARNRVLTLNDPTGWDDLGLTTRSDAGESISKKRAIGYSPVNQAVRMISGDVAKLPLNVYKRLDEQDREIDRKHPAHKLIAKHGRANGQLSTLKLWRRLLVSALLWENGWIWIQRTGDGRPLYLYNLLPDRTWLQDINGKLWVCSEIGGSVEAFDYDDVLHLEGIREQHGDGYDLVEAARHDIGLALASRKFASKFFAKGGHFGGVLQVPPGASDKARRKVEKGLERRMGADHAFTSLVLRDGFKWFNTTVEPEKATVTQIDENQVRHVARFFNMQPSKLGVKDSVSYNSREADNQDYFDTTLSYWMVGLLSELNLKLLTEKQQNASSHFIDYNVNALHWTDAQTRWGIYEAGIRSTILSPDECRRFENLNRRPDGDGDKYQNPNTTASSDAASDESDADRAAIESQQLQAVLDSHRQLVIDAVTRIASRLGIQATRAAKRGDLYGFIESLQKQHGDRCRDIWEPVRQSCHSCGLGASTDLVESIFTAFAGDLRNVIFSNPDAGDLLAATITHCDKYADQAGEIFANQFFDQKGKGNNR